mgnify:CR=1 FL=1
MDYELKIKLVKDFIEELKQIKELLIQVENEVCMVEKDISDIDSALPSDKDIAAMPAGVEKEQIQHLIDLNNQAFNIIDEILGPPEDEMTGEPEGTRFSPEARGNGDISLDAILANMKAGGKNSVS